MANEFDWESFWKTFGYQEREEDDDDDCVPGMTVEELLPTSRAIKNLYDSFVRVGFKSEIALEFTIRLLAGFSK